MAAPQTPDRPTYVQRLARGSAGREILPAPQSAPSPVPPSPGFSDFGDDAPPKTPPPPTARDAAAPPGGAATPVTPEESAPVASVDDADVVASVDEADVFGTPVDGGGDVFAYLDGLAREANERARDAASGGPREPEASAPPVPPSPLASPFPFGRAADRYYLSEIDEEATRSSLGGSSPRASSPAAPEASPRVSWWARSPRAAPPRGLETPNAATQEPPPPVSPPPVSPPAVSPPPVSPRAPVSPPPVSPPPASPRASWLPWSAAPPLSPSSPPPRPAPPAVSPRASWLPWAAATPRGERESFAEEADAADPSPADPAADAALGAEAEPELLAVLAWARARLRAQRGVEKRQAAPWAPRSEPSSDVLSAAFAAAAAEAGPAAGDAYEATTRTPHRAPSGARTYQVFLSPAMAKARKAAAPPPGLAADAVAACGGDATVAIAADAAPRLAVLLPRLGLSGAAPAIAPTSFRRSASGRTSTENVIG